MANDHAPKPVPVWGQILLGVYWLLLMTFLAYFTAKLWPPVAPPPAATSNQPAKSPDVNQPAPAAPPADAKKAAPPAAAEEKKTEAKGATAPPATLQQPTSGEKGAPEKPPENRPVWLFWGMIQFTITRDVRLILLVLVVGALGASVHAATSFGAFVGNQRLHSSWIWYYLLRPPIGATLALIFYFVVRGGFLNPSSTSGDVNDFGIVAVAGLVGMFSKQATAKLDELFSNLFRTDKQAELGGKLAAKAPVLTAVNPAAIHAGIPDTSITITGTGFTQKSEVKWAGSALATQFVSATEVKATVPAASLAAAGSFEVLVFEPPPGGGASNTMKVTVS